MTLYLSGPTLMVIAVMLGWLVVTIYGYWRTLTVVPEQQIVERGDHVRDTITRFTGTVVARIEYVNGCIRFQVTSDTMQDGKPVDDFFDAHQLEILEKAKVYALPLTTPLAHVQPPKPEEAREPVTTGGPARTNPVRPAIPRR